MLKLRSDYKPPSCRVVDARLNIDIHSDHTQVTTTLSLERLDPAPFLLHGRDLELKSLRIGDTIIAEADWPMTDDGLMLADLPEQVVVETVPFATQRPTRRSRGYICQVACTAHNASQKGSGGSAFTLIVRM